LQENIKKLLSISGKEVIQVLLEFGAIVERASIDEAYVDLTNIVNEKMNQVCGWTNYSDAWSINGIFFFKNFTPDFLIDQLNNTFVVGFDESEETRKSGWFILIMQIFLS